MVLTPLSVEALRETLFTVTLAEVLRTLNCTVTSLLSRDNFTASMTTGETVTETAQFAEAFERALAAGRPALLELQIDPDAINTRTTLSAIRARALQ